MPAKNLFISLGLLLATLLTPLGMANGETETNPRKAMLHLLLSPQERPLPAIDQWKKTARQDLWNRAALPVNAVTKTALSVLYLDFASAWEGFLDCLFTPARLGDLTPLERRQAALYHHTHWHPAWNATPEAKIKAQKTAAKLKRLRARDMVARGYFWMRKGQWHNALRAFQDAQKMNPENPNAPHGQKAAAARLSSLRRARQTCRGYAPGASTTPQRNWMLHLCLRGATLAPSLQPHALALQKAEKKARHDRMAYLFTGARADGPLPPAAPRHAALERGLRAVHPALPVSWVGRGLALLLGQSPGESEWRSAAAQYLRHCKITGKLSEKDRRLALRLGKSFEKAGFPGPARRWYRLAPQPEKHVARLNKKSARQAKHTPPKEKGTSPEEAGFLERLIPWNIGLEGSAGADGFALLPRLYPKRLPAESESLYAD